MKKHIYIIRHAEANSSNYGVVDDIDRTLSTQGIIEANKIGKCFLDKRIVFDSIITSSASRAMHTGVIIARSTNFNLKELTVLDELYLAPVPQILKSIQNCSNNYNTIALVAHNPGVSDLAIQTGQFLVLKTAGVIHYTANIDDWKNINLTDFVFENLVCDDNPLSS